MTQSPHKPAWLFPLLSAAAITAVVITYAAAHNFALRVDIYNSDFFKLWLGARLVAEGIDPYNSEAWLAGHDLYNVTWRPNPTYLYPLPLAILFFPLTRLPFQWAYIFWFFLSIWSVIGSVFLLLKLARIPRIYHLVLPLIAGAFLFRPTLVTLRNGQLGAILLLIIALSVYLWQKDRWFFGGVIFALLILKPQLGGPILLLVGLWLLFERRWRALAGMGLSGIILLLIGLLVNPSWLGGFLSIGRHRLSETFGYSPTVHGLSGLYCKYDYGCTLLSGSLTSLFLCVLIIWLLVHYRIHSPATVIATVIPVALLITPYVWAYDQILLVIPISIVVIRLFERQIPYLLTALMFLIIDVAALALLMLATQIGVDIWSAAIPFACLILVIFTTYQLKNSDIHITETSFY
jgi:hypothetical protein